MSETQIQTQTSSIIAQYNAAPSALRESIRTLFSNIQFASLSRRVQTLTITSTMPNEGKTSTSCYLGIAAAELNRRVLIVECDLRKPQVGNCFSRRNRVGLTDFVTSSCSFADIITYTDIRGLGYVDMGTKVFNPVEIFSTEQFAYFIDQAKQLFDFIIFDTPPLYSFIDAALIAAQTDGALLVVKPGYASRDKIADVVQQLQKADANLLGVVMSRVEVKKSEEYAYSYYEKNADRAKEKTK